MIEPHATPATRAAAVTLDLAGGLAGLCCIRESDRDLRSVVHPLLNAPDDSDHAPPTLSRSVGTVH
jgi:hypothetical protein